VIDFITQLVTFTNDNAEEIRKLKDEADEIVKTKEKFNLAWELDREYHEDLLFKGYEYVMSEGSGQGRRRGSYDHNQPWEEVIPYYTDFNPTLTVKKPYAYVVPQAWEEIIEKFDNNSVTYHRLKEDMLIEVESYYIEESTPSTRATQGHKLNNNIKVRSKVQEMQYYKGDYIVLVNQHSNKYIVEMLEPHAPNSLLVWNYFDPILESSDFYSIWGFESHLFELLEEDEELRKALDDKKAADPDFASDRVQQLQFLYEISEASEIEKWQKLYPVSRINKEIDLPLGE